MFMITPMVRNLLIINVVVFIATTSIMDYRHATQLFALHDFRSEFFRPHQIVTHMFMHGGWPHLFSNMFSLFIFGPMLERHWGGGKFLTFYLICGIGASLLYSGSRIYEIHEIEQTVNQFMDNPSPIVLRNFLEDQGMRHLVSPEFLVQYFRNPDSSLHVLEAKKIMTIGYERAINMPMLGASGAVFAILMAFGLLFPNIELFLLFFPIPIKAKYFVLMYGAYELYAGFSRNPGDNVAHFAHLGGMLFAYILIRMWERQSFDEY